MTSIFFSSIEIHTALSSVFVLLFTFDYWVIFTITVLHVHEMLASGCSYSSTFQIGTCRYHVPRSWLQPTRNLLVVFEELGGDSSKIALVKRSVSSVCADVSEDHPNIKKWQIESYGEREYHRAKVHLKCAPGQSISAIKFASFGTPMGTCGSFQQGDCHSANSHTVVEKVGSLSWSFQLSPCYIYIKKTWGMNFAVLFSFVTPCYVSCEQKCIGLQRCVVAISPENFGGDPCPNVTKRVAVEAVCSPTA